VLFFASAHYRQPVQYSDETLGAARARVEGIRNAGRRLVDGPSPEDLAPIRDRFFDALADDFGTPAALAELSAWVSEANRREGVGREHLAEMLGVLGLENLLDRGREPMAEDLELLEAARPPGPPRTSPRPTACATRSPRAGGRSGTRPRAPSSSRATRDRALRAQPRPRGAARRRREVRRVWATTGAAKEPWLQGARVERATGEEVAERCGSDAHQGICADVGPYPYVRAEEILATPDPLIVALDEVQDPQNLGAIARTAEAAGAAGLVIPERRSAEVTPAAAKASAGAVEHLSIARVRNLADFLGDAKQAGCWAYGADGSAPASYLDPDYTGGVVLVLGAEGKGLRPRVAASCDQLVALPLHGRMESLNVSAAAAVLLFEAVRRRSHNSAR
jgi:23S rRNA (guanosine2251-2'-O)-methyltransferase